VGSKFQISFKEIWGNPSQNTPTSPSNKSSIKIPENRKEKSPKQIPLKKQKNKNLQQTREQVN
jgi:hypothetical protein